MNKQTTIIVGIFAVVALSVALWFWFDSTKPDQSLIDAQSQHIQPANSNLLSTNSMENLSARTVNGDIPVKVEANYNNEDIFN